MSWDYILFFPGVVSHEISHLLACLLTGTRVYGIKLWGLKEAYVKHEEPGIFSMIFISIAPLIFNSLIALFFIYLGLVYTAKDIGLAAISWWLALSLAYHAFPSLDDTNNAYQVLVKNWVSAMTGRKGLVIGILAWVLFIPVFIPLIALVGLEYVFSQVEGLGAVWFLLLVLSMLIFIPINP